MKVRINADVVYIGGSKPFVYKGDEVYLPKPMAQELLNNGLAVVIEEDEQENKHLTQTEKPKASTRKTKEG